MSRGARSTVLIPVVVLGTVLAGFASANSAPAGDPLARWDGGELDRGLFEAIYSPSGRVTDPGKGELRTAVLEAACIEIYSAKALALKIDEEADTQERIKSWEERRLAALYRKNFEPDPKSVITQEAMETYYHENAETLFRRDETVDFEMLFVRCSLENRSNCRTKMKQIRRQIVATGDIETPMAELGSLHGKANGVFHDVTLKTLSAEVGQALMETPEGNLSPLIETPLGIFLARMTLRKPGEAPPFDVVRERIVADLKARAHDSWIEGVVREMRELGFEDQGVEHDLAEAARLERLDRDESFVRMRTRIMKRELALAAIQRDPHLMPSDDQLRASAADPEFAESHLQRRLLIAMIDASRNRYDAFRAVSQIEDRLRSADNPGSAFRSLGDDFSGVRLEDPGFLSIREIEALHPKFPDVVRDMEIGQWRGPILLSPSLQRVLVDGGITRKDHLPSGFAFLFLEQDLVPPFELVRDELLRSKAQSILNQTQNVEKVLKDIWKLEILVGLESQPPPSRAP